jgi:hypothetical protein
VQDPALAHRLVAFIAVLVGCPGEAGADERAEDGEEEEGRRSMHSVHGIHASPGADVLA